MAKARTSVTGGSTLVHVLGFIFNATGLAADFTLYKNPARENDFGGRYKYLTTICQLMTFAGCTYAASIDVYFLWFASSKHENTTTSTDYRIIFIKVRDHMMSVWVYPMGLFVSFMYIALALLDRNTVHDPAIEKVVPFFSLYNFYLHLLPLLFSLTAMSVVNYRFSDRKRWYLCISIFTASVLLWMAYTKTVNGYWPYKFMEGFTLFGYLVFIAFCCSFACLQCFICRKFSDLVWMIHDIRNVSRKLN